jgi:hypothetical protein
MRRQMGQRDGQLTVVACHLSNYISRAYGFISLNGGEVRIKIHPSVDRVFLTVGDLYFLFLAVSVPKTSSSLASGAGLTLFS